MERKYKLAGVNILIETDFDFHDTVSYIPFRCDFDTPDLIYKFITVDELSLPPSEPIYHDRMTTIFRENGITYRLYSYSGGANRAVLSDEHINEGLLTVYVQAMDPPYIMTELRVLDHIAVEHVMALHGGVLLHSSFISYDDKAILFTAPSQTGKSTQAELWRKHRGADVKNGDRSLIKITDGVLRAYSLPYCGTSGICENYSAQIRAIVVLRQAPYNRISTLRPSEAFRHLYEGCAVNVWYSDDVRTICDIVENIISSVPVYLLECLPDSDAVETLANELGL